MFFDSVRRAHTRWISRLFRRKCTVVEYVARVRGVTGLSIEKQPSGAQAARNNIQGPSLQSGMALQLPGKAVSRYFSGVANLGPPTCTLVTRSCVR